MKKKLYYVGAVISSSEVEVGGFKSMLTLSWTNGMIGVIPAFNDEQAAERYAGERFNVVQIECNPISGEVKPCSK